ncbi:OmpA family protein [Microbulbifer sp. SAOS-129_SWC]|uniref:OmpA family protein n=1 Tax=Microbulbifer sp. SAOS-129_SWC TaxID=3145235 RepID=UPI0032165512
MFRSRRAFSASCLLLLSSVLLFCGLLLSGCFDPHKQYTNYPLNPLARIADGPDEQAARRAAPFGDAMVRYLRGKARRGGDEFVLRVDFEPGGFAPEMDSIGDVEALLVIMRDFPRLRIAIEGHTDSAGDAQKNLKLSQWRADWVRSFLVERGIDAARIEAEGFGDTQPIADNSTPAGQEKNRRLVVRVLNFDSAPIEVALPGARH